MVCKVFFSSTSKDLADYREVVLDAIRGLDGFVPIAMEDFSARDAAAIDFVEKKVRQSDVLVGVLGHCYGSSPRDQPPSFTEQEYDAAAEIGRLMFVAPDDFPVPRNLIEPDEQRERQDAFRARAMADRIVDASFDGPAALASAVTKALANWRAEREQVDTIVEELIAANARAAELERALQEGQKEREALRAAVTALAKKAEEPDPPAGIDQALAHLSEGKTADAEALFQQIVERKTAEGEAADQKAAAANQEAAAAARHLGALATLGNTENAIEAYETAARLHPSDTWSWIFLGRLQQQAGRLEAAEQAFRRALAAAEGAGDERDASVATAYLGDVRRAQGNLTGAIQAYDQTLAIQTDLAEQDPGNADREHDLSVSHEKIGDVRVAQGDLAGALDAYGASHAIAERLAAQDPGNAGWQRDLIVSHWGFADLAERDDRADEARRHWQAALDIAKELVASGRLAPTDGYFVETIESRLAALGQAVTKD